MKIHVGPAGIPLRSKGKPILNGIQTVKDIGLNCMEVEFTYGVRMANALAEQCGELAKKLGIKLSVHAPYYINLASHDKSKLKASERRILESVQRAHYLHVDVVVFHPGFYGKHTKENAFEIVKDACEDLHKKIKSSGYHVKLGLETMGKQGQFGTLDEIIRVCKSVSGCVPVIDWAHINCRTAGSLKEQKDYAEVFNKLKVLKLKHLHCHFTGDAFTVVGIGKGNEKVHLPISSNKPPFKPLAKEILKRKMNVTLISESPLLENDALYMKNVFEKLGYEF